jgi:hypothetical protein
MNEDLKKRLSKDPDGLLTYEYIANNINEIDSVLPELVENMIAVDGNGQFCVSAARYLHAIDAAKYADSIKYLIASAIDKDRERAYIGMLLADIWGADYADRAEELSSADDNFRRIYKRLYPSGM